MKRMIHIAVVCLASATLIFSTFGCASTKRVDALEKQINAAMMKADQTAADVQAVKAASEECCANSEEAVKASNAAADRAEAAATKAEAIFNKNMKK